MDFHCHYPNKKEDPCSFLPPFHLPSIIVDSLRTDYCCILTVTIPSRIYFDCRFLEGDFNEYVRHIRKPHVWGGEPELLMCSHVLM